MALVESEAYFGALARGASHDAAAEIAALDPHASALTRLAAGLRFVVCLAAANLGLTGLVLYLLLAGG